MVDTSQSEKLIGIPTSSGYYSGPISVVQGLEDMDKVQPGDVLVIPYSDVGWSPLFTRANAVIAEAGGILSHSSILAREYQIPAVVSVTEAMRLPDRMIVTVDGYRGEIILHRNTDSEVVSSESFGQ
jgi:pyruvate,water dikinase